MRIFIVVSYYSPHISGLTLYVNKLANILISQKHSVTILTNKHDKNLKNEETISNVKIVRLPIHFKLSKSPISLSLLKKSLQLINQADLVILNLPSSESVLVAPLSKILGRKLLIIHHCDPVVPGALGGIFTVLATLLNFYACMFANKIITYTLDYAKFSPVLKYFLYKTTPILPPVNIQKPNQKIISIFKKKIGSTKYTIGFAGRISYDKGVKYLFEAIPFISDQIPDFKIVIAGPTRPVGETYFDSMQKLVDSNKKYIFFLESIPPGQMINFYSCIDCLVLPSINRTESFGMVQIESMLVGKPVIASDIPGVRQSVLITGGGRIAPPQNPSELANQIVKVLKNPREHNPKNLDKFSVKSYSTNIKKVLQKI